ncbi:retroviral-like aspartic protease family protein [Candidatus Bathyarchaeota archaeon]|nr:retroviral-like aspartic protease family protein [Candidatus Bathyarchaeota archaeon]
MGVFETKAIIWNVEDLSKRVDVELLVDTGATYTVIPSKLLEFIGVSKVRMVRLRLADNRVVVKPLGEVGIEIQGFKATATPVIFGEEGIFLLGSVTMEQLGLAPDPIEKRLKQVEALLM